MKPPTWDQLLAASLKSKKGEPVPRGFKTTKEWAAIYKRNPSTIDDMFRKVGAEEKLIRVLVGAQVRSVRHWRV